MFLRKSISMKLYSILFIFFIVSDMSNLYARIQIKVPVVISFKHIVDPVGLRIMLFKNFNFVDVEQEENKVPFHVKRVYQSKKLFFDPGCLRINKYEETIILQPIQMSYVEPDKDGFFLKTIRSSGQDIFDKTMVADESGTTIVQSHILPESHVNTVSHVAVVRNFSDIVKKVERFLRNSDKR